MLNTPHNPTGKVISNDLLPLLVLVSRVIAYDLLPQVFSLKEMQEIATIVKKNPNVIVIADEVYKHAIYDPLEPGDGTVVGHYHFARLPGKDDISTNASYVFVHVFPVFHIYVARYVGQNNHSVQ